MTSRSDLTRTCMAIDKYLLDSGYIQTDELPRPEDYEHNTPTELESLADLSIFHPHERQAILKIRSKLSRTP